MSSQATSVETATGIGASVRRKEDFRFITGKGQYTDDISRPGETRALFVRSPHAHARIKKVDVDAASKMPGVLAVLAGAELATDKIGNLICGWMIHSKDGSPMKMSAHPAIASGKACYVGDPVAVVVAETVAAARDAAEKVQVDYEVLPAVTDPAKAQSQPAIHEVAPKNTIYQWHLGDAKAVDAALEVLRENLRSLGLEDKATVARALSKEHSTDIAFIDPPYALEGEYRSALEQLADTRCELIIAQHATRFALEAAYGRLRKTRVLRQGDNSLSFFESSAGE